MSTPDPARKPSSNSDAPAKGPKESDFLDTLNRASEEQIAANSLSDFRAFFHGPEPGVEFCRLVRLLLERKIARHGLKGLPFNAPLHQMSAFTTTLTEGSFEGLEPAVNVSVAWVDLEDRLGVLAYLALHAVESDQDKRIKSWLFITPDGYPEAIWQGMKRAVEQRGIEAVNRGGDLVLGWLKRSPALLARYQPELARELPEGEALPHMPFREWRAELHRRAVAAHRDLRLFGFPDRRSHLEDDPHSVDPRKFHLDHVFVPQLFEPESAPGRLEKIDDLQRAGEVRLLLGGPGTGKTSILRYLALQCRETGSAGMWRVPLFIALRDFADDSRERPSLRDALGHAVIASRDGAAAKPLPVHPWFLDGLLEMGEAEVFLDGLDEVSDLTARQKVADAIRDFRRVYPLVSLWITSRIVGYESAGFRKDSGFRHWRVLPFNREQQEAFIGKWFEAQFPGLELSARREEQETLFFDAVDHALPETRELAENPLLLTLMAWVQYDRGRLPDSRGDLYESCVDMLVRRREADRAVAENRSFHLAIEKLEPKITPQIARHYFAQIALRAQEADERQEGGKRGAIRTESLRFWLKEIRGKDRERAEVQNSALGGSLESDVEAFLNHAEERTGLLRYRGGKEHAFIHLSVQEYLAACAKTDTRDRSSEKLARFILQKVAKDTWRETLLLMLFRLRDTSADEAFVDLLVDKVQKANRGKPPDTAQILFLGMALRDGQPFSPRRLEHILGWLLDLWGRCGEFRSAADQVLLAVMRYSEDAQKPLLSMLRERRDGASHDIAGDYMKLELRGFGWPGQRKPQEFDGERAAILVAEFQSWMDPGRDPRPVDLVADVLSVANGRGLVDEPTSRLLARTVQERLAEGMVDGAIDVKRRHELGLALGRLFDPRPGVAPAWPPTAEAPFFAWGMRVEAGTEFEMGGDPEAWRGKSSRRIRFPAPFRLARYPVTNAQYDHFEGSAYFAEKGLKRRDKNDARFLAPNQPVVNVMWHDAMHFCGWISGELAAGRVQPEWLGADVEDLKLNSDWLIRLPTEAEWEFSARGPEGRLLPWAPRGQESAVALSERCNMAETGLDETFAVGLFPEGKSTEDCLDLIGNVWEWTRTRYRDAPSDFAEQLIAVIDSSELRVLRGGSWNVVVQGLLRCVTRYVTHPGERNINVGFRCVLVPRG